MKKFFALILAAMLCLTMCACGNSNADKQTLIVGFDAEFPPFGFIGADGKYDGFDLAMARELCKRLGWEYKETAIDWNSKDSELSSGNINCIWNGFTANAKEKDGTERKDLVDFSSTYMLNQQCIVVKKSELDSYKTKADLVGKTAAVEMGSAGESFAEEAVGTDGKLIGFTAQNATFMEVKTGKSDFAVVDVLLAKNICGKGDYTDIAIVEAEDLTLEAEYYAIGFKKGSDLTAKVNEAIKTLNENSKLLEIAKRYGLENSLQVAEFNG